MKHLLMLVLPLLIACNNTRQAVDKTPITANVPLLWSEEKGGIRLTEVYSIQFPNATLVMDQPADATTIKADSVKFSYQVHNFQLGVMTGDYVGKRCANSAQGQHIHQILNNAPYTAHYETGFSKKLPDGHYVCLSFLSRSYHESVKDASAYTLTQFVVGTGVHEAADLTTPHLFYSRPKDTYTGDDTEKVLLDFYLANCNLSANGYQVRATINGTSFKLHKWVPYIMEGLPMGENVIKLELLDNNGLLVKSPFNPVVRRITLIQ
jgi:hypothetical protein